MKLLSRLRLAWNALMQNQNYLDYMKNVKQISYKEGVTHESNDMCKYMDILADKCRSKEKFIGRFNNKTSLFQMNESEGFESLMGGAEIKWVKNEYISSVFCKKWIVDKSWIKSNYKGNAHLNFMDRSIMNTNEFKRFISKTKEDFSALAIDVISDIVSYEVKFDELNNNISIECYINVYNIKNERKNI